MTHLWTILGVRDVAASLAWYQALLGILATPPAHDHFGQLLDDHGSVLLSLHAWGAHEHPTLVAPSDVAHGNGLILFFRVDDYEGVIARVRARSLALEEEPHLNPNTRTPEFSLRDPDGYFVTISQR
jgi:catechol 2,3-dioxygenase-like lactoylglutathione lyase family enzyme